MSLDGAALIAEERIRQQDVERFDGTHDDQHNGGELAIAGAVYALPQYLRGVLGFRPDPHGVPGVVPALWPFTDEWWKPRDRKRDLIRAGAFVAAELDRLLRADG